VVCRLTSWLGGLAFRRTVAVVCALAFLIVSFAHTFHHIDGTATQAEYQLSSVSGSDDTPDPAKKASGSVEHCHGCGMTALLSEPVSLNLSETADRTTTQIVGIRPHPPAFENPPPIASI